MDALVRAFASEDDAVVVAADEGDVVEDCDGGAGEGDGEASDDDGDAATRLRATQGTRRAICLTDPVFPCCLSCTQSSGAALEVVRAFWEGEPLM